MHFLAEFLHYSGSVGFHLDDYLPALISKKGPEVSNGEFAKEVGSQPDVELDAIDPLPNTVTGSGSSDHLNNCKFQTF